MSPLASLIRGEPHVHGTAFVSATSIEPRMYLTLAKIPTVQVANPKDETYIQLGNGWSVSFKTTSGRRILLDLIRGTPPIAAASAIPASVAIGGYYERLIVTGDHAQKSDVPNGTPQLRWWRVYFANREPQEIFCNPLTYAKTLLGAIVGAGRVEALANGSHDGRTELDQYGHRSQTEVELTLPRAAACASRGVPFIEADQLACQLVDRDRTGDARRSCAEYIAFIRGRCQHKYPFESTNSMWGFNFSTDKIFQSTLTPPYLLHADYRGSNLKLSPWIG